MVLIVSYPIMQSNFIPNLLCCVNSSRDGIICSNYNMVFFENTADLKTEKIRTKLHKHCSEWIIFVKRTAASTNFLKSVHFLSCTFQMLYSIKTRKWVNIACAVPYSKNWTLEMHPKWTYTRTPCPVILLVVFMTFFRDGI